MGYRWKTLQVYAVFHKTVKLSKEHRILLVLDNYFYHLNVEILELAKENGIVLLSFAPHCSHKLHPLNVSIFEPFKRYCASAQDTWLGNNADKTSNIYDIPKIVDDSLPFVRTSMNMCIVFRKTGMIPYNAIIFGES